MSKIAETVKSLAKIMLQSRPVSLGRVVDGGRIIIMGNGPSLNTTIEQHIDVLKTTPTMAVNFAALAPVFFDLKPKYYLMADPHFFCAGDGGGNLDTLRHHFGKIDWSMTQFVPARYRSATKKYYSGDFATKKSQFCTNIRTFNAVGIEGFKPLTHAAYRHNLGMPRPRNVLIPAVMVAIALGYNEIIIVGADHSWMRTLSVTDDNEVVSVQPHFYKDSDREEARVRHEYRGYSLYQIVESFAIAFKAYHQIAAYAASRNVRILNATPGSMIDAFPRTTL